MKIYKVTDRIPIVIGEVTVWLSPVSFDQKAALNAVVSRDAGEEKVDGYKLAFLSLKYGVKKIEGVENADGSPYELEFDSSGQALTDECAMELIQFGESEKLVKAVTRLLNEVKDYQIPGVKIDLKGVVSAKKKP